MRKGKCNWINIGLHILYNYFKRTWRVESILLSISLCPFLHVKGKKAIILYFIVFISSISDLMDYIFAVLEPQMEDQSMLLLLNTVHKLLFRFSGFQLHSDQGLLLISLKTRSSICTMLFFPNSQTTILLFGAFHFCSFYSSIVISLPTSVPKVWDHGSCRLLIFCTYWNHHITDLGCN